MKDISRYEEMGYEFDRRVPLNGIQADYEKAYEGVVKYTAQTVFFTREHDIYRVLDILATNHLQVPGANSPALWLQRGVACALNFFLDEWKIEGESGMDMVSAKRNKVRDLYWYDSFSRSLMFLLLSEQWEDLDKLCCWPWAELEPEYAGMGGDLEVEIAYMYLIIAAALRSEPMQGLDKLDKKIRKSRLRRPRLLMKCWDAMLAKDQQAFDKAMIKSLQHFHKGKKPDPNDARMAEWLALPQTAICLATQPLGLAFPDLPRELSNYVMTRASIGIDAEEEG